MQIERHVLNGVSPPSPVPSSLLHRHNEWTMEEEDHKSTSNEKVVKARNSTSKPIFTLVRASFHLVPFLLKTFLNGDPVAVAV